MVEAMLFASPEPLSLRDLQDRLPHGSDAAEAVAALRRHYSGRGVELLRVGEAAHGQDAVRLIPAALPGISTGVILSTSRAIGEAAPLIMLGALTFTSMVPGAIDSPIKLKPSSRQARKPLRRAS